ncbi:uncharacterized protein LOC132309120 [Cornus florida]|uniref:uncharacterized protein LOC132309120 n=1 Tax=Cornus florida TaxID=4283 RepID=UPI00289D94D1|nr:uncharacterized protein LOC132309120 [Cornus florida]
MTVTEYENKFTSLLRFTPGIARDEERKIEKFVNRLDLTIRPIVAASEPTEYTKAVQKALVVEAESKDSKAIRESYKHSRSMCDISKGSSQGQRTQGHVYVVTQAEPSSSHSVVRGMFFVFNYWARLLFDYGASYFFIASSFARALGLEVGQLDRPICVDTPIGGSVTLGRVCRGCSITFVGWVLKFDLILLEMTGFDVILGMDWLSSFRAVINCFRDTVSVYTPNGDCFCFMGDRCDSLTPLFYGVRGQDRQGFFLASLFADDDVQFCGVDYSVVVRDFLDVFPEDLTELPPH